MKLKTGRRKVVPLRLKTPQGLRLIGPGHPVFIIGEMSGNHNHEFDRALRLIDAAVDAGVDAVKLQTYTADTITLDCKGDYFDIKSGEWAGETLYSLYQKAHTPWEWQPKLIQYGESKGITVFSTPFDETAVDFLESLNTPLYKVASFESGHLPLLRRIGRTRKPVIMSRGLTPEVDIEVAIKTLTKAGCPQVAVLHCVSSYPALPAQMNLRTIPDLSERFGVVAGLSDHSMGLVTPVAAVSLGASIVEKHFTLARADGGPDSRFSLERAELKDLVTHIRTAEACLGKVSYTPGAKEAENVVFRRSIFIVQDVKRGDILSPENIRIIRPGHGMLPRHYDEVLGKRLKRDAKRGTPLTRELIQ